MPLMYSHSLGSLETKTNQYNLDMNGLNTFEIVFLRKHKKLIQKYNDEITILGKKPETIDADTKAIPGSDNQEQ